jgi:hypothetical protein
MLWTPDPVVFQFEIRRSLTIASPSPSASCMLSRKHTKVIMDGFLEWAKRQWGHWIKEIRLLESGVKTTSEVRDGRPIDTTEETLGERRSQLNELEALITKHEIHDTKRP